MVVVLVLLVEMVTSTAVPLVVEPVPVVPVEELVQQSLVHIHHICSVDLMVALEFLDLVVVVVTKVVVAVALRKLVLMLSVLEHLELRVVVQVVMEKRFQQHIYQTILQKQLLDQILVNS